MQVDGEVLGDPEDAVAGEYPQLTGYASEEWLRDFLSNPGAEQHYGSKNAMPSFKKRMTDTDKDRDLLIRWMRHRWYEPSRDRTTDGPPPVSAE